MHEFKKQPQNKRIELKFLVEVLLPTDKVAGPWKTKLANLNMVPLLKRSTIHSLSFFLGQIVVFFLLKISIHFNRTDSMWGHTRDTYE